MNNETILIILTSLAGFLTSSSFITAISKLIKNNKNKSNIIKNLKKDKDIKINLENYQIILDEYYSQLSEIKNEIVESKKELGNLNNQDEFSGTEILVDNLLDQYDINNNDTN